MSGSGSQSKNLFLIQILSDQGLNVSVICLNNSGVPGGGGGIAPLILSSRISKSSGFVIS